MQDNIYSVKKVIRNNKLVYKNKFDEAQYKEFISTLSEGQEVQIFFEADKNNGTTAQISKIHVCIRKLATEIGYTFEEMKLEIKKRSGLVYGDLKTSKGFAKSFADCSKEELSLVIESLNQAGSMVNLSFE